MKSYILSWFEPCPDGYWATKIQTRGTHPDIDPSTKWGWMIHRDGRMKTFSKWEPIINNICTLIESATYSNVEGFWNCRYEHLLYAYGHTRDLIERVERATGETTQSRDMYIIRTPGIVHFDRRTRPFRWLHELIVFDWDAEALAGYEKPTIRGD